MTDSLSPETTNRLLRIMAGWAVAAVPAILAMFWQLHQVAEAQAVYRTATSMRIERLEKTIGQLDGIALDVAVIKRLAKAREGRQHWSHPSPKEK